MRFSAEILWVSLTVLIYYIALTLYKKFKSPLLNPVLVSVICLIAILKISGVQAAEYSKSVNVITFFLGPSVVALGFMLSQQWDLIRKNLKAIFWSVSLASLAGILSATAIAYLLGAESKIVATLAPKSVTTPIAIGIAEKTNGIVALTAAIVIAVGVFGAVVGPTFLNMINIKDAFARGLAMGTAAHGIGTARAVEEGETTGTAAALSIGLAGVFTVVFIFLIYFFIGDWDQISNYLNNFFNSSKILTSETKLKISCFSMFFS
ncbi:LrgB family protein [Chondrinema litorale]|uniref:LrgB family protein n=1 Tax=Chondrinema litorale TaxID=2994555 RepID=UPI0025426BFF|nr:LrgB family protein [Chondrinema litorale]UZR95125.1 LrgB family protein [Chondrinema litorale]